MKSHITPLRVLILEDRPADAKLMVHELQRAGFEPEWERVETESDYLDRLRLNPEVILADHNRPRFDAVKALELLKKRDLDTPFIIVTGSISEEVAVERMKQGAADYILKDRMGRLGAAVKAALGEKRLRDEKRQAEAALHARYQELQTLYEISQKVLRSLDLEAILDEILEKVLLIGGFDLGAIQILDRKGKTFEVVVHKGYLDPDNVTEHCKNGKSAATRRNSARAIKTKAPFVLEDLLQVEGMRTLKKEGVRSVVIISIGTEKQELGTIQLGSRTPRKLEKGLLQLLEAIGNQVGIAVQKGRLYQELKEQLVELERSNRVKDEFLGVMSYELRTPLNVVLGYTGMILDGVLGEIGPEQKEGLKKAMRHTCNQLAKVNSVLHAILIEAGTVSGDGHEMDLGSFFDELRLDYNFSLDRRVPLTWEYASDLPPMKTDGIKLKIILKNLIDNALKFTHQGSVTVSARCLPGAESMIFTVADTGLGISEKDLAVIFEKSPQLDNPETQFYSGTGLGLCIVKKFTELLGGAIQAQSEPGKGSIFTVTMPCEAGAAIRPADPLSSRAAAPPERYLRSEVSRSFKPPWLPVMSRVTYNFS